MTCTFFGHREVPSTIKPLLEKEIRRLIESEGYNEFLVGNQGQFDAMAYSTLKHLQTDYPQIRFCVVLAYMPSERNGHELIDCADTIYPDGLEIVPKRFAISHRNRWIILNSQAVICYLRHNWGGAFQAVSLAEKKKLKIIRL